MILLAKWIVIFFGLFIIGVGLMMVLAPQRALATLRKAGSTNFINYAEITIRMIPGAGLILAAELSKYPLFFSLLGWFIVGTSVILYFIPRHLHHGYALMCAHILKPRYVRLLSLPSFLFGGMLLYAVW
jgi:hypothetical protein